MDGTPCAEVVFDRAAFLRSFQDDVELLRAVARGFLDAYAARLAVLRAAFLGRDCAALERAAHDLKGSAAGLAAARTYSAAQRLETLARVGDLSAVEPACAQLEDEVRRLAAALAAVA